MIQYKSIDVNFGRNKHREIKCQSFGLTVLKWLFNTYARPVVYSVTWNMSCTSAPNSISNGYYVGAKTSYSDGDEVHYVCDQNYVLSGNPTVTCTSGVWIGGYPSCSLSFTSNAYFYIVIALLLIVVIIVLSIICVFCCKYGKRRSNRVHDQDEERGLGCCSCCRSRDQYQDDSDDDAPVKKSSEKASNIKRNNLKNEKRSNNDRNNSKNTRTANNNKNSLNNDRNDSMNGKATNINRNIKSSSRKINNQSKASKFNKKLPKSKVFNEKPDNLTRTKHNTKGIGSINDEEKQDSNLSARRVAIEIDAWRPFTKPVRYINTSTK